MLPRKRIRGLISAGRSRRRVAAALALAVAIGIVITVVLADQSPSVSNAASNGGQGSGTASVQRRDLVQSDTESGTLSYANTRTVYNRLTGTITWLPAVGQVIEPGQALYKVAGKPAILMDGTTPAYRDLKASDGPGQDILQLNRDLAALDFNRSGIVVDDQWQPATTVGVELFQESLGESPTGTLTLGQIVFLPGNQLVSGVSAKLGADGASGGSGTPAAYRTPGAPTPQFVSLTTTTSTTPTSTTPTTGTTPRSTGHKPSKGSTGGPQSANTVAALIALLKAESAQLRAESQALRAAQGANSPGSSGSPGAGNNANNNSHNNSSNNSGNHNNNNASNNGANGNGGGGSASAILQTSSTQLVVTVDLDATKQSEAKVGERVTVQMPGGNTVNGTITAVSPVAQSSSGNGGSGGGNGGNGNGSSATATIPVTIALSGHPRGAGLDQAAVSVNFAQARARNVLSVPVTALLATGGGAYAVQEAAAPRSLIPVTTGLFAAGYVEISGPGIYQGLQVTDSQG